MKPKMDGWEIEVIGIVINQLKKRGSIKILEWGAGYSTHLLPSLLDQESQWLAIEHDREWYERLILEIRKTELRDVVDLRLVPDLPYYYVSHVTDQHKPYDFILIDGKYRSRCFNKAYDIIKPNGIICCHDWNTKKYWERITFFPEHSILMSEEQGYLSSRKGWRGLAFFFEDNSLWKNEIEDLL